MLLGFLVVSAGVTGCSVPARETVIAVPAIAAYASEPVGSAAAVARAERVTADEIYTVYSQDLNSGANRDQRFRERLLVVTGVVNGVNRRLASRVYLELRTHDRDGFVYAALSAEARPLLESLVPGASVRLLCRGDGMAVGSPLLRDCRSF